MNFLRRSIKVFQIILNSENKSRKDIQPIFALLLLIDLIIINAFIYLHLPFHENQVLHALFVSVLLGLLLLCIFGFYEV
jgi:uncharacterized membrane protein